MGYRGYSEGTASQKDLKCPALSSHLKEQKEAELQARLKGYTEMIDFVSTQSLRHAVLSPEKPAISGWVFFSVEDRWIGPWRKPEQFILRLPVGSVTVEFPFCVGDGSLNFRNLCERQLLPDPHILYGLREDLEVSYQIRQQIGRAHV